MAPKPLPNIERLRQLLRYDEKAGILYWREISPSVAMPNNRFTPESMAKFWNSRLAGKPAGHSDTKSRMGGLKIRLDRKTYHAGRIIWALYYGEEPNGLVDHINGDRHDNRICNLRCVSSSQNARNRVCGVLSSTGRRGVYRTGNRYRAAAKLKGSFVELGTFETADEAYAARLEFDIKNGFTARHISQPTPSIEG